MFVPFLGGSEASKYHENIYDKKVAPQNLWVKDMSLVFRHAIKAHGNHIFLKLHCYWSHQLFFFFLNRYWLWSKKKESHVVK